MPKAERKRTTVIIRPMPSLWLADRPPPPPAPAELPHRADVVVIGGGLSGVWLALALAEAGRPPLVLERTHLAAGASGRNGGLLLPGTSELYDALAARHGRDAARVLWRWAVDGAADVVAAIARYGIDCDWRPEGALHAATGDDEAARLRAGAAMLAADGFAAAWLSADEIAPWLDVPCPPDVRGALHLPDGGAFHSGRLVAGLAAAAAAGGATFIEGVDVRGIAGAGVGTPAVIDARRGTAAPLTRKVRDPLVIDTDRGPITAEVVVVATNAWLPELLPGLGDAVVPVRGQVLATAPLPTRAVRGAWSLNDGYEYLQQLSDGRLVFGGMRWAAPDREVGPLCVASDVNDALHARLDGWLADNFPTLAASTTIAHRWAGPMCWTADRLPLVGPVVGPSLGRHGDGDDDAATARLWVAGAYSGHGVPVAPAAARLVAAGLTGRPLPAAARLVDPNRRLARPDGDARP